MNLVKEVLLSIYKNNRGKVICTLAGLLIAVFMLLIGFFRTLFIVLLMLLGYYIGKKIDNKESIVEVIERILPDNWK